MAMATGTASTAYSQAFAPRSGRRGVYIQNIEATVGSEEEQLVVAVAKDAASAPATGFLLHSINAAPASNPASQAPFWIPGDQGVYVKRKGSLDVEWVGLDT